MCGKRFCNNATLAAHCDRICSKKKRGKTTTRGFRRDCTIGWETIANFNFRRYLNTQAELRSKCTLTGFWETITRPCINQYQLPDTGPHFQIKEELYGSDRLYRIRRVHVLSGKFAGISACLTVPAQQILLTKTQELEIATKFTRSLDNVLCQLETFGSKSKCNNVLLRSLMNWAIATSYPNLDRAKIFLVRSFRTEDSLRYLHTTVPGYDPEKKERLKASINIPLDRVIGDESPEDLLSSSIVSFAQSIVEAESDILLVCRAFRKLTDTLLHFTGFQGSIERLRESINVYQQRYLRPRKLLQSGFIGGLFDGSVIWRNPITDGRTVAIQCSE